MPFKKTTGYRKSPKRFPKKSDKKTPEEMAIIDRAFAKQTAEPPKKAPAKKKR